MRCYIRQTAIESVSNLLNNLPEHENHPLDAIRMIDRTIGGLLAHADSPSYQGYRDYASLLFPSGLEATRPGKDIILILNRREAVVTKNGRAFTLTIPSSLKYPEKGVAQIIGHDLAWELFIFRGEILKQLIAREENGTDWQVNATANDDACNVLKDYVPYADTNKTTSSHRVNNAGSGTVFKSRRDITLNLVGTMVQAPLLSTLSYPTKSLKAVRQTSYVGCLFSCISGSVDEETTRSDQSMITPR